MELGTELNLETLTKRAGFGPGCKGGPGGGAGVAGKPEGKGAKHTNPHDARAPERNRWSLEAPGKATRFCDLGWPSELGFGRPGVPSRASRLYPQVGSSEV